MVSAEKQLVEAFGGLIYECQVLLVWITEKAHFAVRTGWAQSPGRSTALLKGPAKWCTEGCASAPAACQELVGQSLTQTASHKTWDMWRFMLLCFSASLVLKVFRCACGHHLPTSRLRPCVLFLPGASCSPEMSWHDLQPSVHAALKKKPPDFHRNLWNLHT